MVSTNCNESIPPYNAPHALHISNMGFSTQPPPKQCVYRIYCIFIFIFIFSSHLCSFCVYPLSHSFYIVPYYVCSLFDFDFFPYPPIIRAYQKSKHLIQFTLTIRYMYYACNQIHRYDIQHPVANTNIGSLKAKCQLETTTAKKLKQTKKNEKN